MEARTTHSPKKSRPQGRKAGGGRREGGGEEVERKEKEGEKGGEKGRGVTVTFWSKSVARDFLADHHQMSFQFMCEKIQYDINLMDKLKIHTSFAFIMF